MRNDSNGLTETDIKPKVTTDELHAILEKFYAFKGSSIKQLQGYDDLNYHCTPNISTNQFVKKMWPHGYVLKVMNSLDSRNDALCEAQNAMMLFLRERGIPCTIPVKTVDGRFYVKEKFPLKPGVASIRKDHIVRLLEFQTGILLKDAPKSYSLFHQVGKFVAKLTEVLKNFSHPVYKTHYSIWHLKSVPDIKSKIEELEMSRRKELAEAVREKFTKDVLSKSGTFEQIMIHGDLNENNILMAKDESGEWKVSAILDFGDSHLSCALFELAIALCYMMLECKKHGLDAVVGAAHFLSGYLIIRPNFSLDCGLLKLCICARMCQSLVLGLNAFRLQPENKYVLESQDQGWPLLEELWEVSDESFTEKAESVIQSYNIKCGPKMACS